MNDFQNQWNTVPGYVQDLTDNIRADLVASQTLVGYNVNEWAQLSTVWNSFNREYGRGTGGWQYSINLAFDTSNTKRDLEFFKRQGASCQKPLSSASSITSRASSASSITSRATLTSSGSVTGSISNTAPICPNNPVDENPPGCVQPSSASPTVLKCSAGSNLGLATFVPATWCGCNQGPSTNVYPTLTTGSGDAACAYKTIPSTTVHPTQVITPAFTCTKE